MRLLEVCKVSLGVSIKERYCWSLSTTARRCEIIEGVMQAQTLTPLDQLSFPLSFDLLCPQAATFNMTILFNFSNIILLVSLLPVQASAITYRDFTNTTLYPNKLTLRKVSSYAHARFQQWFGS